MSAHRRLLLGSLFVMLALLLPPIALAHAELVSSEPAAGAVLEASPPRVRLFFSEPIEPDFYALEVYAADATRVDSGDAVIPADNIAALETSLPPLQPGSYTVSWRVLSIDGHVVESTFAFVVGDAAESATVLELPQRRPPFALGATVRWWSYALMFGLVGGLAFLPLVMWPALRAAGVTDRVAERHASRGWLWIAWPAVVALLLLSLLTLAIQAADVTGIALGDVLDGRAMTRLLTRTRYGLWWTLRFVLLAALLAVVAVATVERTPRRGLRWVGLVLGAGLLLPVAASGHASGVEGQPVVPIAADWLHLLAGCVWVGGLLQIVVGLAPALWKLDSVARRRLLAASIRRFSLLAGASVLVLIGTGLYASLIHVPGWRALQETAYGAALSGKLLLIAPLLLLGAFNLLVLHPRFVGWVRGDGTLANTEETNAGVRLFRRVVLAEIAVVVAVLAVTGILTGLPPATSSVGASGPFQETQAVGDLRITLGVTPNEAGDNEMRVTVLTASDQPVAGAEVTVRLEHQDMEMGERQIVVEPVEPGIYAASGNFISMDGRWQAQVSVRRDGAAEQTTAFAFTAAAPATAQGSGAPTFSPARIIANAFTPLAGIGLVALLFAGLIFAQRPRLRRARDRRRSALVGATLVVGGILATGSALSSAYSATLPNPIPATEASLATGRQIYVQNCAGCHGVTGRGDGPQGVMLRPRPADFRVHMAAGHTDPQLFAWISRGVDGTAMPAFEGQLSREEIWHVINYIRTFAEGTSTAGP